LDGRPRGTNLVAVSDAELLRLEAADFTRLLYEAPDFAMAIMQQLTRLARKLNGRIHLLTATVPTRICAELLRLARFNLIGGNKARLVPAPRHLDIANRINTHREAVSRTIGDLQRQQVVRRGQGELMVLDVAALQRYAEGEPLPTNAPRHAAEN
jgi:CRP-like cAMP-binding protein